MTPRLGKKTQVLVLNFILFLSWVSPAFSMNKDISDEIHVQSTYEARILVEKAWEIYHHSALGGTLASPMKQVELEAGLHRSRGLLTEAYDAEDRGDIETMRKLIGRIMKITYQVIAGSQEPKR